MNDLSERIKKAVVESGKTQRRIADEIGVTEVSVSRYIKGDRTPKADTMAKLAKACGVNIKWLAYGEGSAKSHCEMILDFVIRDDSLELCENKGALIRCKDCKYWRADSDHTCRYLGGATPWPACGYCSFAERRGKA